MLRGADQAATVRACDRLHQLDSLRGIAALVVVLHHALLSLPAGDTLPATLHAAVILRIVELGRPAVMLFFVLSGFALTLCLERAHETVAGFAVRRAARLLPPFWVAILASYPVYQLLALHHASNFSLWFTSQWSQPISVYDLARHLAMRAGTRQFPLDHVAWSLVHEMRLSLIVPLLAVIAGRRGPVTCLSLAAAISGAASLVVVTVPGAFPAGIYGFRFDAEPLAASLVLSAQYVLPFAIGVILARCRVATAAGLARLPRAAIFGCFASFALLSQVNEVLMLVGSAGVVAIVAGSATCARALACAPLVWIGRVSYSLYLVHLPVLLACGLALDGLLAPRVTVCLAIVLALVLAEFMFRLVERPSIVLSRAAGRALAARTRAITSEPIAEAAIICAATLPLTSPATSSSAN